MQSFIDRFKKFRRPPREHHKVGTKVSSPASLQLQRKPAIESLMEAPPILPGEDHTSFKWHNQVLLSESKKAKPNMQVVNSLMERSYAFRRRDIISSSDSVKRHLDEYPFLGTADQVNSWPL